ncbi:MAG: hypothetical protein HG447_000330 [Prevotella sp.]|nr:hypothetical protein [Prevotella sp.]
MLIRLLDVLGELFVLAFVLWGIVGVPSRVKIAYNCIKEHNQRDAIGNSLFLLILLALWVYVAWSWIDLPRFWEVLIQ